MALDPAAEHAPSSEPPDVIRACMTMTAAGLAVAVLPYALMTAMFVGLSWWHGEVSPLDVDDVTGVARVLLLCTLIAGLGALGLGIRAAWRVRAALRGHGGIGVWLVVVMATLTLWCWPPLQYFTSAWMLAGATLATRPLRWALASSGPLDRDDIRSLRLQVSGLAVVIVLVSHVAAWTAVIGLAQHVPAEEFARVESIRRGEPVERREWEQSPGSDASGFDVIDATMSGATAAERYVGGDMSVWQFAVGYWPTLAEQWVAPQPEGPTRRESWWVAVLAFALSLAFWMPATAAWTWAGLPRPRPPDHPS